jgi:choline kinase
MKRKAIILVAGMGTRLKPRTDNTHKCLTEVNGCKILVNALTQLKNNSVDETILVVGYL